MVLDCGHKEDKGQMTTVDGKPYRGWTSRLLENGQKVCTLCYCERTVLECGHHPLLTAEDYLTTGYGIDKDGKRFCYACCADRDRAEMVRTGKAMLYLSGNTVSNWPGSLKFVASYVKKSKGWGFGREYPIETGYFTGPDGKPWSIHVRGDMQCGRARRLKK